MWKSRFGGSCYKYVGEDYASSLIVGIMENPQDITSIVPIDTVTIERTNSFKEFIVSLENYTGKGRYVVFASAFDKENIFYLDNVTFDYKPANPRIMDVSVSKITTNTATVQIDPRGSNWEVVVTSEETADPASVQSPVYKQTNLSGSTHELTNLPSGGSVCVCAFGRSRRHVWRMVYRCSVPYVLQSAIAHVFWLRRR